MRQYRYLHSIASGDSLDTASAGAGVDNDVVRRMRKRLLPASAVLTRPLNLPGTPYSNLPDLSGCCAFSVGIASMLLQMQTRPDICLPLPMSPARRQVYRGMVLPGKTSRPRRKGKRICCCCNMISLSL